MAFVNGRQGLYGQQQSLLPLVVWESVDVSCWALDSRKLPLSLTASVNVMPLDLSSNSS